MTETGLNFLEKLKSKFITKLGIQPLDQDGDLEGGEIIEILGKTQTGKTELCLSICIHCILPSEFKGIKFEGEGVDVLYFDNDHKLSIWRVLEILETKIFAEIKQKTGKNELTDEDLNEIFGENISLEEFTRNCLSRIKVFQCKDAFQFWVTLKGIKNASIIIVDSLNSFYYESPEDMDKISKYLLELQKLNVVIIATKYPLYKTNNYEKEIMSHKWGQSVKKKLYLESKNEENDRVAILNNKKYKFQICDYGILFE
jgi:archaellum biogenesis ATPase FlaH